MAKENNSAEASEEMKNTAIELGRKLGFLIDKLFLKDEEKQAMLVMAENMSPEQLMGFIDVLEQKYLEAINKPIDLAYQKEISALAMDYKSKMDAKNAKVLEKLAEIEKEIS